MQRNCDDIRGLLPLFAYDDLSAEDARAVARHLADCAACQADHAGLMQTRSALDAGPTVAVALDPLALLRAESARQTIRLRRWRRAAITIGALAASLILVLALRVQVRAGNGELVVAWGAPRVSEPVVRVDPQPEFAERLLLVQELTRALAAELDARDGNTRGQIVGVQADLAALQRVTTDRWNETERDVAALYTAYRHPNSGEKQ